MEEKVSIIIPVYNTSNCLEKCIDSVIKQTYRNIQIILVDDGSTDNSGAICDTYANGYERIKVVHQNNSGVSTARNRGIEAAEGKYIMFVDSDDYIDSEMVEYAVNKIEEAHADEYISGLVIEYYENGKIKESEEKGIIAESELSRKELLEQFEVVYSLMCVCGPCCKLYLTTVIKDNNIRFDTKMNFGEDSNFNFTYLKYVKKVYFSQKCNYHYHREGQDSLFSRFHPDCHEVHVLVYDKMRNLMLQDKCSNEAMKRFETMYCLSLVGGIIEYYKYRNKTTKQQRKGQIRKVAGDYHFRKYQTRNIDNISKMIVLNMIKSKMYWAVNLLFLIMYH